MRILVTGGGGLLGCDVVSELAKRGEQVNAPNSRELDITDQASVERVFADFRPDAVIHCAAYTKVDKAEDEREYAYRVNEQGTSSLAKLCRETEAKLLYVSTDYVFDGSGTHFWKTEDKCAPLNIYGASKRAGELAVEMSLNQYFIVRTSWAFGNSGDNFVNTMLKRGRLQDKVQVVCDQTGSPAYTRDLAVLFADMIRTDKYGYYHAANEGICTRYELVREIFAQAEALGYERYSSEQLEVEAVLTSDFPAKAKRPLNSRLDTTKLEEKGFNRLPGWQDAVRRYLQERIWDR